jgi:5-methylcytosine-specific restriction protein A
VGGADFGWDCLLGENMSSSVSQMAKRYSHMPHKIKGPCTFPRCNQRSVQKGRCAAHPRKERKEGGVAPHRQERNAMYNTPYWKATSLGVLAGEPYCRECGHPATCVDHIVPHRGNKELFMCDPETGLQALCDPCHGMKTAREQMERRAR